MGAEGPGIWTPGGEHRPRQEQPPPEQPPPEQPPQEELTAEQVAQLMRELKIADFLLSNVSTLAQLAYTKLDRTSRDLPEARLAIDALRALLGVLEGSIPADVSRDFGRLVSNLQLAFVGAVDEEPETPPSGAVDAEPQAPPSGAAG